MRLDLSSEDGVLTVELSLIMPMMFFVIVAFIYLTLFYIDMMTVKSEVTLIADDVAASWKVDGDLETGAFDSKELLDREIYYLMKNHGSVTSRAEEKLETELRQKLIFVKMGSCSVTGGREYITATAQISLPIPFVADIIGKELQFQGIAKAVIDNRAEALRLLGGR